MSIKFFGQYLLEKKLITRKDLINAIDLQEQTNLRFGDLVLKQGLMTSAQAGEVHRAQRRTDLQFGEMAIKLGYLCDDQVQQILHLQRSTHLFIGQALVKLEVISKAELDRTLADFNAEQNSFHSDKVCIPAGVPHQSIWDIVADQLHKTLTRVAGLSNRPGPCSTIATPASGPIIIEMGFSGEVSAHFLVSMSEKGHRLIANAILKENSDDPQLGQTLDDSLLAFVNIACGNIATKATQLGYNIDITPPRLREPDAPPEAFTGEAKIGMLLPIDLTEGEVFEINIFVARQQPCRDREF
jgi:CheY-specific phosphatase CheX